jgi:serine/threonine-protein kinase
MEPERWKRIRGVLEEALEQPPEEWSHFLDRACGSDEDLRREVESLLARAGEAENLLENPPVSGAEKRDDSPERSLVGRSLTHYEILDEIGRGGMGVVYRARDNELGREVAIKVLPEEFLEGAERLARFEREARLLATLNHPHIATIHELGRSEEVHFLVMELVDGEDLSQRIARGPIPVQEALLLLKQIAEALAVAHEKGIVHRDLKPANVKTTPDGKVKVLDFGLAKAVAVDSSPSDLSRSPTLTREGAERGVILGTAAYMSPEQAEGKTLDRRTDIWSFGCVFYEALTGRRAFAGKTVSDTIEFILEREPDWKALPAKTPLKIRDLLRRCLQKDPNRRLRDIGDARIEIEEALAEPSSALPAAVAPRRHRWVPWTLVLLASAVALWTLQRPAPSPSRAVRRFALDFPQEVTGLGMLALSPDGSRLVYANGGYGGGGLLYLYRMDQMDSTAIPGTEGADMPFFSPDGHWVAFFGGDGKLKKIDLRGGLPITLCDAPNGRGGSWGEDDTILFAPEAMSGLSRVSASGGSPAVVTTPDPSHGEVSHRYPEFLPGGKAALFTTWKNPFRESQISLLILETGKHRVLLEGGYNEKFSPTGHIAYARIPRLMAAPFDLESLALLGQPVPILERVERDGFSLSLDGSLAYIPDVLEESTLMWVDRKGQSRPLTDLRRSFDFGPRLSPDGRHLALTMYTDGMAHIWVYDLERDALTRLSSGTVSDFLPLWTPDGTRITYVSGSDIVWQAADGSGAVETLTRGAFQFNVIPDSWSPDGRMLAFTKGDDTFSDIWLLPIEGDRTPRPFFETPFDERGAAFSPDGRWIAYVSNESGRYEVYVRPYPGPGGKSQVSTEGGVQPAWARSGREIFYRNEGNKMMAVTVETEPAFRPSKPRLLFEGQFLGGAGTIGNSKLGRAMYDIAPYGEHFVMLRSEEESAPRIHVVLNWAEELKAKVPPARR